MSRERKNKQLLHTGGRRIGFIDGKIPRCEASLEFDYTNTTLDSMLNKLKERLIIDAFKQLYIINMISNKPYCKYEEEIRDMLEKDNREIRKTKCIDCLFCKEKIEHLETCCIKKHKCLKYNANLSDVYNSNICYDFISNKNKRIEI